MEKLKPVQDTKLDKIRKSVDSTMENLLRNSKLMLFGEKGQLISEKWNREIVPYLVKYAPSTKDLQKFVESRTTFNADQDKRQFPGIISCGTDIENYFTICSLLFGRKKAKDIVKHELEHFQAYQIAGVNAELLLLFGKNDSGTWDMIPAVAPSFPETMKITDRQKILMEALKVVKEKSSGDNVFISQLEL